MINSIVKQIFGSALFKSLGADRDVKITGLQGSLYSFFVEYANRNINSKTLVISPSKEKLSKIKDDLELISVNNNISIFSSEKSVDKEEWTRSLNSLTNGGEFIVLLHAPELETHVLDANMYRDSLLHLKKNQEFLFEELLQKLGEYGFTRKDFVDEVGDYSVRGGIVDLFPEHYDSPLRLEFFGETIDSIREFDITSQRSTKELDEIIIGINLEHKATEEKENRSTIADYIQNDFLLIIDESDTIDNAAFQGRISGNRKFYTSSFKTSDTDIDFGARPQPDFRSNVKTLYRNLQEYSDYKSFLLSSDSYQSDRLKKLIEDYEEDALIEELFESPISSKINFFNESVQEGFIIPESKILIYTEHQIFGRYFIQSKKKKRKFRGMTFDEVKELKPGDYVVHRDFGIGIYSGLKKIKVGNSEQEVAKLSYSDGDVIFLNLNYVNLINKYSAGEGISPKLTRLGGGEWSKIKDRAKKKVKDIARDLILLYAKRKSERGFAFSPDTHWQRELEASFIFEDTPDQYTSTEEVKNDMMSVSPMDRLVCGDVGFGKTEVAVRAAFKAVLDNKQVAVLVPTTILAVQHYNTFRDRLSPFAVEVSVLSRLQSRKEQKATLEKLEEGKVNILIGTHRILSQDIRFKDIGLLIIDEEQRFGVKAKEKLRAIKPNVDTLTLTATPIPRTLNFSLLGARDLSVINTPPKNRKPILTEIVNFDWKIIADAVRKELSRNGQVYFVNDKISNLGELADKMKLNVPEARIGIAHGQMTPAELEDVIIAFIEKKLNVLLCTKIIESGLDIPNVNTIIINNANMYGLSELYQLRGRVGRSDAQAYAYFVSPPAGKLTQTAIRRLQAIEEYTDLGSGFNLAMRDMEIRGVGNLLGQQQSGFVHQMGFEMYIDIIEEAVSELKEFEFKELFKEEKALDRLNSKIKKREEQIPAIIENDLNALIPEDYIKNDTERLNVYKKLFDIRFVKDLIKMEEELRDRFGKYGPEVDNLLKIIEIKIKATDLGLEKINIQGNEMLLYFPPDKNHRIFQSDFFTNLVNRLSASRSDKFTFVNKKDRLVILVNLGSEDDTERISGIKDLLTEVLLGQ